MNSIENRIKKILSKQFKKNENQININDNLEKVYNADSLDIIEFIMLLEEEFNIELFDLDIKKIKTIKDTIYYIKKEIKKYK